MTGYLITNLLQIYHWVCRWKLVSIWECCGQKFDVWFSSDSRCSSCFQSKTAVLSVVTDTFVVVICSSSTWWPAARDRDIDDDEWSWFIVVQRMPAPYLFSRIGLDVAWRRRPLLLLRYDTRCYTQGEVTSQYPWPRYDRHFVGITWRNVQR